MPEEVYNPRSSGFCLACALCHPYIGTSPLMFQYHHLIGHAKPLYAEKNGSDILILGDLSGWKDENDTMLVLMYSSMDCEDNGNISKTVGFVNDTHRSISYDRVMNETSQVCIQVSNGCNQSTTIPLICKSTLMLSNCS